MTRKKSSKAKGEGVMNTRPIRKKEESRNLDEFYGKQSALAFQKPVHIGWKVVAGSLLIAAIFGFLAGFGGGISGLVFKSIRVPFVGQFDLEQYLPKREISITTQEKITVTPDIQMDEIAKSAQSQIVRIYEEKPASLQNKGLLGQIYRDDEARGQGFVLTSDGWIVTGSDAIDEASRSDFVAIMSDNRVLPVKGVVTDEFTGISFVKIDAGSLSAAKLGSADYLTVGQKTLVFGESDEMKASHISQLKYYPLGSEMDLVRSSEKFSEYLKINDILPSRFAGSPVMNLKGEVIGVMKHASGDARQSFDTAVPVNYLKGIIAQMLKEGEIIRPWLGVEYIDLSQVGGILDKEFGSLSKGALVFGAPEEGSPAEEAGLENRDVILKVNNDSVNSWYSLTELIQEYAPGTEIELTVLRDGEELVMLLKLGELEQD